MTQSTAIDEKSINADGAVPDRIVRKIKRCIALSASSNQNEAETALRQAQALMREYRLTESDINSDLVGAELRSTGKVRLSNWQRNLGAVAAKAFSCRLIVVKDNYKQEVSFKFVGLLAAAELAAYAYDSLLSQILAAKKKFQKEKGGSRAVGLDFCDAWVHSVASKVSKFAQDNPVQGAQANALVLVEAQEVAAIDSWLSKNSGQLRVLKQTARSNYNQEAVALGLLAGESAQINQAVKYPSGEGPLRIASN